MVVGVCSDYFVAFVSLAFGSLSSRPSDARDPTNNNTTLQPLQRRKPHRPEYAPPKPPRVKRVGSGRATPDPSKINVGKASRLATIPAILTANPRASGTFPLLKTLMPRVCTSLWEDARSRKDTYRIHHVVNQCNNKIVKSENIFYRSVGSRVLITQSLQKSIRGDRGTIWYGYSS